MTQTSQSAGTDDISCASNSNSRLVLEMNSFKRRRLRERLMLSRALARRLAAKAANFDREASRLELRGQAEAAYVLRREAKRIGDIVLKEPLAEAC